MSKRIEAGCLALVVDSPDLLPGNAGRVVLVVRHDRIFDDCWICDGMGQPLITNGGPDMTARVKEQCLRRIDGGDLSADDITEINREEPSHANA